VIRTRVVYTGGTKKNPTYQSIGDHTESIQIDYDPARISYGKLLEVFWSSHNPCQRSGSRQYMTAVFYHNDEQKKQALETRDRQAAKQKEKIVTSILPLGEFYLAEDYHQKYYLRQHADLVKEFKAIYPDTKDFMASTAVARVNGYVGGNGTVAALEKEIASFGLSEKARKNLLELVKQRR
jgi:methionine-S-sulfoxide reductase